MHSAPSSSPAPRRAVRGTEFDCTAGVALNQNYARGHEPLSALQGEREGPDPQGWEGEVGGATNRLVGYPLPPASGGRGVKGRVVRATLRRQIFEQPAFHFPRTALRGAREGGERSETGEGRAAVQIFSHLPAIGDWRESLTVLIKQKTRRTAGGSRTTGYPGAGAPGDC